MINAERIVIIQDNLSTLNLGSLYKVFSPGEDYKLASRFEFHNTPKKASWLNMAEIELSVISKQCLDRRFIRLPSNNSLKRHILPHLKHPVGRPPRGGIQVRVIEFHYQAERWNKPRRVVCKIEWHVGELFPRTGFIVTNSNIEAHTVVTIYNGRAEIENRIKEGKNTLRWDKPSCHRFAANQARLLVGCLAYNLLHMVRDTAFWGESVKPSVDTRL
jgi:hypothetical protein